MYGKKDIGGILKSLLFRRLCIHIVGFLSNALEASARTPGVMAAEVFGLWPVSGQCQEGQWSSDQDKTDTLHVSGAVAMGFDKLHSWLTQVWGGREPSPPLGSGHRVSQRDHCDVRLSTNY